MEKIIIRATGKYNLYNGDLIFETSDGEKIIFDKKSALEIAFTLFDSVDCDYVESLYEVAEKIEEE